MSREFGDQLEGLSSEIRRKEIIKRLNAIGKAIFIEYYHIFKKNDDPVECLPQQFTLKSRRSRTSKARSIFRDRQEVEALEIILDSVRLDPELIHQARTLLEQETAR